MPVKHGINITEITEGARPLTPASTAVIGLIATAPDATNEAYPLDTPVLVTNIRTALAGAGTQGTLSKALNAIADQVSPILIVVRVNEADAEDEEGPTQDELVIGAVTNEGKMTGLQALMAAEGRGMPRPNIIGAPGLDTQLVTVAMVTLAQKLNGFVYARAIGANVAAASAYRNNFAQRELMLIWPDFDGWPGDAVARALGLRAKIDAETGWHKTLSNVAVNGVTAIDRDVFFDIAGNEGDAKVLNDAHVTALVRLNGFRFWGNRTCSDEPKFAFESAVRTAQVLRNTIAEGLIWAIDKPITAGLIKDIIDTINALFRQLQRENRIIGATAWFDEDANPPTALAAGQLVIDYDFTPVAPAEFIQLNQRITDKYYANLATQ